MSISNHRQSACAYLLIAATALAVVRSGYAQEIEPRTYSNAPVGVNFLIAGYGWSEGDVAVDSSLPLTNAEVRSDLAILAYARSLDVGGLSAKFDVIAPYAWTDGSAEFQGEPVQRKVSGWLDPRLRFSVNLYGAPALSLGDFAGYRQDVIIGASVQVGVPLGQYDDDKLLNNGTNRWFIKPELGISKARGPWTFELAAAVKLMGDNDDYFNGRNLEQDPIYSVQVHVIHEFHSGIWAAFDATWYTGGRTTVDGVPGSEFDGNNRAGLTVALPVNRRNSVKISGSTGLGTRTGSDTDILGIVWQSRWGGGL